MGSTAVAQRGARSAADDGQAGGDVVDLSADNWVLVRAAQRGDASAYAVLYDRFATSVHRFALSRVRDRHLAEDVTSETFARALRAINSLEYRGRDAGAWFLTIARNIIFDHTKSGSVRHEVTVDELPDASGHETPEELVILGIARAELIRCLGLLADDQRTCLVLRFFCDLSVNETARMLDREPGAARALQYRAIRRLGELIGGSADGRRRVQPAPSGGEKGS
ncbi:RNA polymerase subunit sigma-70 [Prauserella sp. PE36]|uniref:sigma-70 family RNA polymerase sigma factor n=1 Tax=Prauserella sp. PE36 TaxID=1504709 RepID=UPI000DE4CE8C|nr:sigma-70 family RNA polymerase sigma factor [Prauserella sp. PE36]RBM20600.1 RNA polymerase subunit sigma-70 [Prauserella sp. PE36]